MNQDEYMPSPEDAKALKRYKQEISHCLVRYGRLSATEANQIVERDNLFKIKNDTQLFLIFHEEPYYWAMMMLHAQQNPLWYQDPTLWPPPEDYREWSRGLWDGDE